MSELKLGNYALVKDGLYAGIVAKITGAFPDRVILGVGDTRAFRPENVETDPQVIIEHLQKQKQAWRDTAEKMALLRRDDKELFNIVKDALTAELSGVLRDEDRP